MAEPLIAVLNGPNLNMPGLGEPEAARGATLDDIEQLCAETAESLGLAIDFRQTNSEGELISWVQECRGRAAGIVINPSGLAHSSVVLGDALAAIEVPLVEIHLSNFLAREPFRRRSHVARAAAGLVAGFGPRGYALALTAIADLLLERAP